MVWQALLVFFHAEFVKMMESSIQEVRPDAEAIEAAAGRNEEVPGTRVHRGVHLRMV